MGVVCHGEVHGRGGRDPERSREEEMLPRTEVPDIISYLLGLEAGSTPGCALCLCSLFLSRYWWVGE